MSMTLEQDEIFDRLMELPGATEPSRDDRIEAKRLPYQEYLQVCKHFLGKEPTDLNIKD